jgi:hypothetical protein
MVLNTTRFPLGSLAITPGALEAIVVSLDDIESLVQRHADGDWGEVDDHDKAANDRALEEGTRLLSAYVLEDGTRIYIITEADRSRTTLLLPEEY